VEPLLEDLGQIDLTGIHWVIVGGESGPGCRPIMKPWVESILEQCATFDVPFFFKQWGGYPKKKSGRELNGRDYDQMPDRVVTPIPAKAVRIRLANDLALRNRCKIT
jgi:protein gp37